MCLVETWYGAGKGVPWGPMVRHSSPMSTRHIVERRNQKLWLGDEDGKKEDVSLG